MMVNLSINGRSVKIEPGKTVLEACQKLNIPVPTLCYNKALSPYGACRLCIVEIKRRDKKSIQTSCTTKVEEGIEVRTDTPELLNMRRIVVQLLMARAPNSKKVREIASTLGVKETHFVKLDKDCILCGLCVRMCRERMGRDVLGFSNRGDKREVTPPFDVKSKLCMACGACKFICPTAADRLDKLTDKVSVTIPNEFDEGLRPRPVIHIPFPQAVPNVAVVDEDRCVHLGTDACRVCEEYCEPKAIDFRQREEIFDLNVGSIILACGFDEYDASGRTEYGYGKYPNVITSTEFERILSASGPYDGHVLKPSDRTEPSRIAFIQCVGSRDAKAGNNYCSSVCCTYAIKEAIIAKEHARNELNTTIFFMDIRTFGKGFEAYYERAKKEYGVRFIRAGVSNIDEVGESKNLVVHYESEDGQIMQEEFDIVVLSVGLVPKSDADAIARRLRLIRNEHGFFKSSEFMPMDTVREGIYVCGAAAGPKDIPESVTQASGAAAKAMSLLSSARNNLTVSKSYPVEMDVSEQDLRIGVFVCHCGINIGGYVDVPHVVEYVRSLPNVVYAEHNLYTCSEDTQRKICEIIKLQHVNRVVVASCTPRTHEALFRETIREAGLNPYLFEMANIRDQCSWIHMQEPSAATEKAKDLVRMAVGKARLLKPLKRVEIPVTQRALVLGGGVTGMAASLSLAEQGFEVGLVEREQELGHLKHIYYTIEGKDVQNHLKRLTADVLDHPLVKVYRNAEAKAINGFVGNYETEISIGEGGSEIYKHGVIIVATGAVEYSPQEHFYGKDDRIITQREFEDLLTASASSRRLENIGSLVMIQCVGSRDEKHHYCSRICCSQAVKNSLNFYKANPDANIYVLYKDMRTYGFREDYYQKAREAGAVFIRYDDDHKPEIRMDDGSLSISVMEPILGESIEIKPDLIVLSNGVEANPGNGQLAKMLKVPLNDEGFFLEAHVKLRPVDFATEGVFVAGMAHNPKCIDESISQAEATAARAATIIAHDTYYAEAAVSHVNEDLCAGCGVCSALCPYEAIEIVHEEDRRKSKVNEALCKGCGTCASACPSGAIDQYGFTRDQITAMIEALA
jgi:heterodisulfide reductase subunit A